MPESWITNMAHYLDEDGQLPAELPGPVWYLAEHLGEIIAAVTAETWSSRVQCWRRSCPGEVRGRVEQDGTIRWYCQGCGDDGLIHGWQGTLWDGRLVGNVQ